VKTAKTSLTDLTRETRVGSDECHQGPTETHHGVCVFTRVYHGWWPETLWAVSSRRRVRHEF